MNTFNTLFTVSILYFSFASLAIAKEVDWSTIKGTNMQLFYPGQSSWEWLLTKHSGAKSVRKGSPCLECHEDEEKEMGALIVKGEKLEPDPIPGKHGSVSIKLKTAYDSEHVYFQIKWKDMGFSDNSSDKAKTKLTLMLGDKAVKEFPVAGCWGVCHDDATKMKSNQTGKIRQLYTSASRVKIKRQGGGDNIVDDSELTKLLNRGSFLEFWQIQIQAQGTNKLNHGYILEKRHQHKPAIFSATTTKNKDTWVVEFSRARDVSKTGIIQLTENHPYTLGIALHDNYVSGRRHYVSFGRNFALGNSQSQISAIKLH